MNCEQTFVLLERTRHPALFVQVTNHYFMTALFI